MSTLYLDLETFSQVGIEAGTDAYTNASVPLIVSWAIDDGPVQHACPESHFLPDEFVRAFHAADLLVAHNAQFDRAVLMQCGLKREASAWHCTMNQAYAHGLPGSLNALCNLYKVDNAKVDGKDLIRRFCIPTPGGARNTLDAFPADAKRFIEYACKDVAALRDVHKALPTWNEELERRVRVADTHINLRGVGVDTQLAESVSNMLRAGMHQANARIFELTGGMADAASDRTGLLAWLHDQGIGVNTLEAAALEDLLLSRADLTAQVQEVLRIRLQFGQASVKKFGVVTAAQVKGRLRYTLQYCGAARTGRWSGRTFQPQNLPRPTRRADAIEAAITELKAGRLREEDLIDWAADMVRSVLVPAPGREFVVADLSNIEGRILAWVAGEEWKLEAFRAFDAGQGPDIYVASYAAAFGVPVDQVTKDQRQVGKVMELALGYQGSVGAFTTMAAGYGINLDALADTVLQGEEAARLMSRYERAYDFHCNMVKEPMSRHTFAGIRFLVDRWREAHGATVRLWSDVQDALRDVVEGGRGTTATVRGMTIDRVGTCTRLRLPSGRFLCYHLLTVHPRHGALQCPPSQTLGVQYAKFGPTQPGEPVSIYGGKVVENICQALARDILAAALVDLDRPGAPAQVVMHVHDEVIVETFPGAFGVKHLVMDLTRERPWSAGLPLAAAGFSCNRYRKD